MRFAEHLDLTAEVPFGVFIKNDDTEKRCLYKTTTE